MKKQHTIISKRTTPFIYTKWEERNGQCVQVGRGVVINGGAGVVGGNELLSGRPLEFRTPLIPISVITYVDDEALEYLMSIPKFVHDCKRGVIQVVKGAIEQEKADAISERDMVEDENIPSRPVTEKEIEEAGGSFNKDGSIDISEVDEGISPLKMRKTNAGQPGYVKKRNAENRKRVSEEKKRAAKKR